MAITWTDVETIAPALSDVSEEAQNAILDYVNDTAGHDLALTYLAAHHGQKVIDGPGGAAAAVQSEQVGPLRVTYAVSSVSDDDLESTTWGRLYKSIAYQSHRLPVVLP